MIRKNSMPLMPKSLLLAGVSTSVLLWSVKVIVLELPHNQDNSIGCSDCHAMHGEDASLISFGAQQELVCKSCHNPTGQAASMSDVATHVVHGETIIDCGSCHDPHRPHVSQDPHTQTEAVNLSLIRTDTTKYVEGAVEPAIFQQRSEHFAFSQDEPPYTGICQTCHTLTNHHRNDDSSDHVHYVGVDCTTCHSHESGFLPDGACNVCHGNETNAAPPASVAGSENTGDVEVGAHQSHLFDGTIRQAVPCIECHEVPRLASDDGHIDVHPAELIWGDLAKTGDLVPFWERDDARCSNVYCHGATLPGGRNTQPIWTTVNGTQASCGTCHGVPPPQPHPNAACYTCHSETMTELGGIDVVGGKHIDGETVIVIDGCGDCHDVPPNTGAHQVHYAADPEVATYGGASTATELAPDGSAYAFDCGNCHPVDSDHHGNGVPNSGGGLAEIDLSPVGAPPGSLKARNSQAATYTPGDSVLIDGDGIAYTNGSCSNVYCHSSLEVSVPGPVPLPEVDFPFEGFPIVYPEFLVETYRSYTTIGWQSSLSCDGCHGFPPRTFSDTVDGAAGDSHSWIGPDDFESLHGWTHGYPPIACATCHFDTVTDQGVRTNEGWSVYEPVDITDFSNHVNGQPDVAFTTDLVQFRSAHDLSPATYDPGQKACTDISCHINDNPVLWGTPYRFRSRECNVCHQI